VPNPGLTGWRRHARRPVVIGATIVVVLLIGGATAWAAGGSGNSGYRLTTVVRATVAKSLDVVGSVEPVNDASASFQVAGQVASVSATVGEKVTAGQSLASLDSTALSESVSSAQSTLDSDDAQLTEDEDSQTSSSTATSTTTAKAATTTTTTAVSASGGSPSGTGGTGTASTAISKDQATVVSDQSKESTDQQQEAADLAEAESVCETSSSSPPAPTTTTTSTTPTTTSPTTGTGTSDTSACASALDQVSTDQQLVAKDQSTLATDEDTLAQALSSEASSSTGSSGTTSSPTQSSTSTPSSASSASSATSSATTGAKSGSTGTVGSGSTASDSAEQIASDEAAIDTAKANLVEAQQSLDEAQLSSPISGTITSVGVSVGDTVSAGSSTDVIVIVGTQSYEVTGTLSSTQVASVKVGYSAQVAVDGKTGTRWPARSPRSVPCSRARLGTPIPSSSPCRPRPPGLYSGSTANVSISTGHAKDVLAVPSSAVMIQGTRSYVQTLSSGKLVDNTIKTGIVGDTYTQILSGLGRRVKVSCWRTTPSPCLRRTPQP
jgi:multidrug efflux pump subunit AcrA (membrane-fusion protein)